MNKYGVVGTSSKKYINEFISLLKQGVKVGDYISLDVSDKNLPKITCDNEELVFFKSYIVARQRVDVGEGMGLLERNIKGFKIMFDKVNGDKIVDFTKLSLIDFSEQKKANEYRFTVIVTTLVFAGLLNEVDIKKLKIKQARGEITIPKIESIVSDYEKQLSQDKKFINIIKKKVWNV